MGKFHFAWIILACLAAAGCTRSTNALSIDTRPAPLPSQPSGSVQGSQLDPISQDRLAAGGNPSIVGIDGTQTPVEGDTQTASLQPQQPALNATPLNHEQLAGAWNVVSDSPGCRVFLSFTQWSGGYRAGSRSCSSTELAGVTAWDVKGPQVVLFDSNGAEVAKLASAGTEQYAGATSGGLSITFTR